jgi:uncharacterized protein YjiS (DUF1127 family)
MAILERYSFGSMTLGSFRRAANLLAKATIAAMDGMVRTRQRRELLSLSDAMMKDIGISRSDAEREAGKAFWRD